MGYGYAFHPGVTIILQLQRSGERKFIPWVNNPLNTVGIQLAVSLCKLHLGGGVGYVADTH